jgi:hypothetical protein
MQYHQVPEGRQLSDLALHDAPLPIAAALVSQAKRSWANFSSP